MGGTMSTQITSTTIDNSTDTESVTDGVTDGEIEDGKECDIEDKAEVPEDAVVVSLNKVVPNLKVKPVIVVNNKAVSAIKLADTHTGYKSFPDVLRDTKTTFNLDENIQSTTLDIISVYLKGQKILYIESKIYCEFYLYRLMLPAIFISTVCSAISGILKDYSYAATAVCILTGFNSFLLTLVTYLKLDAKAEAHKTSAYSYEKLQTMCEFNSGRILLTNVENNKAICSNTLRIIEKEVIDIKDKNQFIIPEAIRYKFPILYSTNIFSEVKRIQNQEFILINKLKVILNRGAYLKNIIDDGDATAKIKEEKHQQYISKNIAIENIIKFRDSYRMLDYKFRDEINNNIKQSTSKCRACVWLKT